MSEQPCISFVRDDDGSPDDVVIRASLVHVERMDDTHVWMGVTDESGNDWGANFYVKKGRLRWTMERQ